MGEKVTTRCKTCRDLPTKCGHSEKGAHVAFPFCLSHFFYVAEKVPNIVGNVKIGSSFLWHGTYRGERKKELLERQMFWNSVEELEKNARAHINYFTFLSHSNRKKTQERAYEA